MNSQAKVRFITLGCKVNQYETQGMREVLERARVESLTAEGKPAEVDFVVINTCTVTEGADRENRYWIRRARREHPRARIVVTGCGVVRNRKQIEMLPEVDLVLSNPEKAEIANRLLGGCADPILQDKEAGQRRHAYLPLSISRSEGLGRAFVKVQDGCNHACSFCKVVLVRGRSRSRGLKDILEEVRRLRDSGYKEVVFTGIQLGAYGLDFAQGEKRNLVDVLEASAKVEGIERLRLSSIEPIDVTADLIKTLASIPQCCHHLHLPLQSGDDEILKRMDRRYRSSFYTELIARLKSVMPDFSLTLDVMAGFPGEEEEHFQNTIGVLEKVQPLKCHVFPYSRREGTRAARFENVRAGVVHQRVRRLIDLAERIGREVRLPYIGKEISVLVEAQKKNTALLQGLTSNYFKVSFQGAPGWVGRIVPVRLLALEGNTFLGRVIKTARESLRHSERSEES